MWIELATTVCFELSTPCCKIWTWLHCNLCTRNADQHSTSALYVTIAAPNRLCFALSGVVFWTPAPGTLSAPSSGEVGREQLQEAGIGSMQDLLHESCVLQSPLL